MAALAAGALVVTAASLAVILGGHNTRPKLGVCQSTGPGLIDWEDGTQTSYAAVGSTTTSVLYQVAVPTHPSLLGSVVQVAGSDPGSRVQGPVVDHFDTLDPAGGAGPELVVVKTTIGYVVALYSQATVLPAA
jgi:hypothetical protein